MPHGVQIPSYGVSLIVHMAAAIVLMLLSVREVEPYVEPDVLSALQPAETEPTQIAVQPPQELQLEALDAALQFDASQLASLELSEVSASAMATPDIGSLDVSASTLGEIGQLFGDGAYGLSEGGGGAQGATSFFGVTTRGRRFLYVVDNSNSMGGGKFETAVAELLRSVDQLQPNHYFYVIFFSDAAYPLFYPQTAESWVPATTQNKYRLQAWLATVQMCLQTRGEEALARAFAMRPDVIYLLGDGAFTDKAVEKTLALRGAPVTMHTLGFNMQAKDRAGFEELAKTFGGKFTDVTVPPEMVQLAKNLNRPRNRTRNGPWGIRLPAK